MKKKITESYEDAKKRLPQSSIAMTNGFFGFFGALLAAITVAACLAIIFLVMAFLGLVLGLFGA